MRRVTPLISFVLVIAAAGCETPPPTMRADAELDVALVHLYKTEAADNAIVRQHTIFPYHFVTDTAVLNELGHRDLQVLARHYRAHGGRLNVRQGEAAGGLYDQRVAAVLDALDEAGVSRGTVEISDGLAGGDGMASDRVQEVLSDKPDTPTGTDARTTTSDQTMRDSGY